MGPIRSPPAGSARALLSSAEKGAALYLFFYYAGAAVLSTGGGLAWDAGDWPTVVAYAGGIATLALLAGLVLSLRSGAASNTPSPPIGG